MSTEGRGQLAGVLVGTVLAVPGDSEEALVAESRRVRVEVGGGEGVKKPLCNTFKKIYLSTVSQEGEHTWCPQAH